MDRGPWVRPGVGFFYAIHAHADARNSSATISLPPDYKLIETEDWRMDVEGGDYSSTTGNSKYI